MPKFIHTAKTDLGTVIEPGKAAVIAVDDGLRILIPGDEEANINEFAQALVAAAMKIQTDEDFREDMIETFK